MRTRIFNSLSFDPWYNLALEEHLLENICQDDEVILYLWQNKGTVVIGRNQNAWKQCRTGEMEADNIKLARRLSGGGAVFHDLGNLNFTFIMSHRLYDLARQLEVILKAAQSQGVSAEFSGRNDITALGRKFSGNAFYFEEQRAYHHGTVLVDADVASMMRYLQVSDAKMRSKAIESVHSRVINLKEINPDITISGMQGALKDAFAQVYASPEAVLDIGPETWDAGALYEKYSAWNWRFGETPRFDVEFSTRFPWGEVQVGLFVKKGHIISATIYTDAMNSQLMPSLAPLLAGAPLQAQAITQRLALSDLSQDDQIIVGDVAAWLALETEKL
jgi:lipoate-protein ligase A